MNGQHETLQSELKKLEARRHPLEQAGASAAGIETGVRLLKLFGGLFAGVLFYAIWAAWFAGAGLPRRDIPLSGPGPTVWGTVTVPLTTDMSPVRVMLHARAHTGPAIERSIEIHDSKGTLVFRTRADQSGDKEKPDRVAETVVGVGLFEVKANDDYRIGLQATPGGTSIGLRSVQVELRRNARDAHFFRNGFFVLAAALIAGWWWKRRFMPSLPAAASAASVEPAQHTIAPPGDETLTPAQRFLHRAGLEGLAFLLSAARVPIVGAYAMLVTMAGVLCLDGFSRDAAKQVFESPRTWKILGWLLPEGEFHGMEALIEVGKAAGIVIFGFYLLTVPFRILLPAGSRPTIGTKARRLMWGNLVFLGALALILPWIRLPPNDGYWDVLGLFTLLTAAIFVPALILLAISTGIENAIDRRDPRA